jgi:hypothetical protein
MPFVSDPTGLSGRGQVFNGETFLVHVEYKIHVHHTYLDASHLGGSGTIPGLDRNELTLTGLPAGIPLQDRLTLVLTNGKKLNFLQMGDGRVTATGAIY